MRPGLFSCLVGERVGRSVLESDGDDAAIVYEFEERLSALKEELAEVSKELWHR